MTTPARPPGPRAAPVAGATPVIVTPQGHVVPPAEPASTADVVASVVLAVPGVVRLHGGAFGELGTYLPGRRVAGVRVDDDGTEVHVVVSDLVPIPDTAARIQRAVSAIAPMPVRVHVEDIDTVI